MTKTLTEQWRNEELPIDLYYVIDKIGRETIGNDCGIRDMMVDALNGGNIFIKEVLAPVPSYEEYRELLRHSELSRNLVYEVLINQKEYNELLDKAKENKRLQEKLAIATKALKEYANCKPTVWMSCVTADEALKEMEGVK